MAGRGIEFRLPASANRRRSFAWPRSASTLICGIRVSLLDLGLGDGLDDAVDQMQDRRRFGARHGELAIEGVGIGRGERGNGL